MSGTVSNCCYSGFVPRDERVDSFQTGVLGICCAGQSAAGNLPQHIESWDSTGNTIGIVDTVRYIEVNEDLDTIVSTDNLFCLARSIIAVIVTLSRTQQFTPPAEDIGTWSLEVVDQNGTAFAGSSSESLVIGTDGDFVGSLVYSLDATLPALTRFAICFGITGPNNPNTAPQLAGSVSVIYDTPPS